MRISDWSSDVCSSDLREGDGLANPVAGVGAAEDRIFEDRVEAAFGVVVGIAVAGRIKARQAKAHPVVIVAELGRGEAGADLRRPAGEDAVPVLAQRGIEARSEEHTSELQSLMRISYAVFCLTKTNHAYESSVPT